jgi:hypothetical protein
MSTSSTPVLHQTELADLDSLKPHPRNYREHPEGQRAHLVASLQEHGVYRNVVVAEDGTILAGHGVVESAREAGLSQVPVVRLPLAPDDPRAVKVLVADNELARLADSDDRLLADLLKEMRDTDLASLLGTGWDDLALAVLLGEGITDPGEAWGGMPEYESEDRQSAFRCVIHFRTLEDVEPFFTLIQRQQAAQVWWPEHDGFVGESSTGVVRWEEAS